MIKENFKKILSYAPQVNGGFIVVSILMFVLGWQFGHRDLRLSWKDYKPDFKIVNQQPPNRDLDIDFKLFWDTWDLVSSKYIDKKAIDPQKLYYGAIQGMVAAVGDPYTAFLSPQAQKASKEQLGGEFEGVGMQLGFNKDKRLVVIAPLKDTPAAKAGIMAGDLILDIDGKETTSLSLPEAVNLIRGPKGSAVTLSLFQEGDDKPREIKLVRETITVKSVEFEAKNSNVSSKSIEEKTTKSGRKVAYIRISSFGEKTDSEWDAAVGETLASGALGAVIDLRNNPGGFLDAAVYIASEFLESGNVVLQENYLGQRVEQGVVRAGRLLRLPLVVLVNKGSASASEIFAGAMQDRERGKVVGEQSFGKGTIQSTEDLPGGTGIHITTAKWLTPNGRWIHDIGLTPDVKIEMGEDPQKDSQLEKALEILDQS